MLGIPKETCGEQEERTHFSASNKFQHSQTQEGISWPDSAPVQRYLLQHYGLLLLQEGLELGRGEDLLHLLRRDHLRGHHGHGHGDLRQQGHVTTANLDLQNSPQTPTAPLPEHLHIPHPCVTFG